ncbi:hypothetical protein O0L34_g8322 [Tuta absoluta]|nr:hypothetical protein O0L34_g8322 [Tuta absoluta]
MFVFFILLGFSSAIGLYYLIGKYNENYWKKRGVAFYTENKVLGPLWEFLRTDRALFQLYHKIYKKFPDAPAVGLGSFMTPTLYVLDPQNMHHVLQAEFQSFSHRGVEFSRSDLLADNILFMNGVRWKLMRQGMSPLFTTSKLKDMFYIIDKSAKDFLDLIRKDPSKLKHDVFDTLSTFCGAAIGAAVFGIQTESVFDSPFLEVARTAFAPTAIRNIKFAISSLSLSALKTLRISVFDDNVDFFVGAIKQVIRQRERESVKKHDFADMCVTLQKNGMLRDPETGFELEPTDELLAAQGFFFFVAGVEPTASAIYATFIELGRNPDILQKVHDEIDRVWDKYDGNLTYEAISEMEYLDKVLDEALRMYPPIGFLTRMCVRDSVLPVGNIKIPKGTKIQIPLFEIHHDSKYFPDPEVFDPERFSEGNKINDILYQPFGSGGRKCIGMRYARLQTKAGIVHVLKEYSIKTTVLEGGIKYSKQAVQVRPVNVDLELVPRKVKNN